VAETQTKSQARLFQMDVVGPKRQMLLFPSWDLRAGEGARCIHTALSGDLIDRRTQLLCVERSPDIVAPIRAHLEFLGLTSRTRLHEGELKDLALRPVERFDFAFFDLHDALDRDTAFWIADVFTDKIVPEADISFSVRHTDAGNRFFQECRLAFGATYRTHAATVRDAFQITDRQVLIHALMLLTLFRDYRLDYHPARIFRSGSKPMIAFKFTGLRPATGPVDWPTIREVAETGSRLREAAEARRTSR
jgi:hypothetical protein